MILTPYWCSWNRHSRNLVGCRSHCVYNDNDLCTVSSRRQFSGNFLTSIAPVDQYCLSPAPYRSSIVIFICLFLSVVLEILPHSWSTKIFSSIYTEPCLRPMVSFCVIRISMMRSNYQKLIE